LSESQPSLGVLTDSSHDVPRSLRTTLCLQFSASDIANAVLYLGKATLCSKASDLIFFPSSHRSLTVRVCLLNSHDSFAASKLLGKTLNLRKDWWNEYRIEQLACDEISNQIMDLYDANKKMDEPLL
jgi:hypothetical protein